VIQITSERAPITDKQDLHQNGEMQEVGGFSSPAPGQRSGQLPALGDIPRAAAQFPVGAEAQEELRWTARD